MFLPDPTRACLPRAVWWVCPPRRQCTELWVQTVTGEPLRESYPVKG